MVYYTQQVLEIGDIAQHTGPHRKTTSLAWKQSTRVRGKTKPQALLEFPQEKQEDKLNNLGLANLNNCGRL